MVFNRSLAALILALVGGVALAQAPFARREGLNLNSFVKAGPVAAHVLLRSGNDPRILVVFPAGNSGVGLWFARTPAPSEWTMAAAPRPITRTDARGRPLHGVSFRATVRAPQLAVRQAVLSSVRVLRDFQALGTAPPEVTVPVRVEGSSLVWSRDRLDGAPGYRLAVTVKRGTVAGGTIRADDGGEIAVAVEALTGEVPLTPFAPGALLAATATADPGARAALEFLSFREKFLAGSWRFDTYFGRDTLMSVRLLMPVLQAQAVETGLRSVLARLSPDGDVAHEEDIGEFAILDHRKADGSSSAAPVYDYKMIDSAFMLAPVARAWLVDDPRGRTRAADFLAGHEGQRTNGAALMANLRHVVAAAEPFAQNPRWQKLVVLKPGMEVGEWRDSNDGLGGGRYPYDVNAVLVPAALDAAAAMARAGLLAPYATAADRAMLARLPRLAETWRTRAPGLFLQTISAAEAGAKIAAYARAQGVPVPARPVEPVTFHAIALDKAGQPVPIQHSDEGFALLFERPDAAALDLAATTIAQPFPAGLMTGVGMVVANPAFAPPALQARFGPDAYHGTVVWSWHQALAAAGLARQIARTDLPAATCGRLRTAQGRLWSAIDAGRAVQSSELWSWRFVDGRYQVAPFGAGTSDADESNAAQLWSTVFLAVQRPQVDGGGCAVR